MWKFSKRSVAVPEDSVRKSRVIWNSQYERNNVESFDKWCELFRLLETKYAIPVAFREEEVEKILPKNLFQKIARLLLLLKTENFPCDNNESRTKIRFKQEICSRKKKATALYIPYIEFFENSPENVAIWKKDTDQKPLEKMTLEEKCDCLTNKVVEKFLNYANKFEEEEDHKHFTRIKIKQLFEIQFDEEAKQDKTTKKNAPCARRKPEESMKYLKLQKDFVSRNYRYKREHEDLRNMKCVFQGITYLTSTKAYCTWLKNHSDKPMPPYLKEIDSI